jgi:hypothetical protein
LSFLYYHLKNSNIKSDNIKSSWGHHGRDRIVVGFTTTYAIRGLGEWCLAPLSTEKNNYIQSDSLKSHFHVEKHYLIIMGPSCL